MIDLLKYENLLDEQIVVTCLDGKEVTGEWMDWTSAQDNEPDPESMTIRRADGAQIEIFIEEVKAIQKAHN
ncbi:MAG: hypothetical protein RR142_06060 [Clostridia bacterium]